MTDRELLGLAAKAAGAKMTDYSDRTPGHWIIQHPDGIWRTWDPLSDDGDALRLAVRLGIDITAAVYDHCEINIGSHPDPCLATRRAIVCAAAEMGEGQ